MIKYVNIRIMPKMSQKEKYCVILLLCGTKSSQITEADSRMVAASSWWTEE